MAPPSRIIILSGIIAAIFGVLAGFLGGWLAARQVARAPAVIQAELFQLVDQNGRPRGRLEVDPLGVARLVLFGQKAASPLVSLSADSQGGADLELSDQTGRSAVKIAAAPQGVRHIALYHQGKLRLGLKVPENGDPAVNLYNPDHRLITLGLSHQNNPQLIFYGASGKNALELFGGQNGNHRLTIYGKNGIPRLVLGLKDDNKAALGLFDRRGKTRVALMDEPSLILLKAGRLMRKLP
jgi:hypothetical protein